MIKKKNNDKEYYLTDVRQPNKNGLKKKKAGGGNFLSKIAEEKDSEKKIPLNIKVASKKNFKKAFLIFAVLFLVLAAILFFQVKSFALLVNEKFSDFSQAVLSQRYMTERQSIAEGQSVIEGQPKDDLAKQGFSEVFRFLVSAPSFFSSTKLFLKEIRSLSEILSEIKSEGINWIFEDGKTLLDKLESAKDKIKNINKFLAEINRLGGLSLSHKGNAFSNYPANYLEIYHRLISAEDFLESLIALLRPKDNLRPKDSLSKQSHLLLLFENASEIRPAGGFVGSYAHLEISDGKIKKIEVNDIAYPDGLWDSKIIPPSPLQLIAASWEARDANWFFDFRISAEKIKLFLESSPLYKDKQIIFDGVIAVNHRVLGDIFQIIDKIELPDRQIVLDKDNYLYEIQREVSTDSFIRGSERKDLLKELTPKLIDKIKNFDENQKNQFFGFLSQRIKNKDIKFYFSDKKIQKFIEESGVAGDVYELPDNFFGDYLAVVNANINGGKTDAFIKQRIILKSELDGSAIDVLTPALGQGRIYNNLQIEREHTGDSQKAVFYRAINQNFIRILTPKNSVVDFILGNTVKNIKPKLNYSRLGYKKDPDVELFEKGEESGKQIFGYWFNVSPGKKGKLELSYERPILISEGVFRFVYEKQSGVDSAFEYYLKAPKGYIFAETQTSEFIYINENPPSRLIIDLNLKKIN